MYRYVAVVVEIRLTQHNIEREKPVSKLFSLPNNSISDTILQGNRARNSLPQQRTFVDTKPLHHLTTWSQYLRREWLNHLCLFNVSFPLSSPFILQPFPFFPHSQVTLYYIFWLSIVTGTDSMKH